MIALQRKLAVFLALSVALLGLVGCGRGATGQTGQKSPTGTARQVELNVVVLGTSIEAIGDINSEFERKNPGVRVRIKDAQAWQLLGPAGGSPNPSALDGVDVIYAPSQVLGGLASGKLVRDLSAVKVPALNELVSRLYDDLGQVEGKRYGLPISVSPAMMLVNEQDLAAAIQLGLEDEDWRVEHVGDGRTGLVRAQSGEHDLLILDIRLPGMSGLDLCRQIRRSSNVPVLFLTARGTETDKVIGLELGADDYLTKPFGMRELRARIAALLRRSTLRGEEERRIRVHDLLIFPERQAVYRGERRIHLTTSEFQLLLTLAQRPGRVFSRESLMAALWQTERNTGSPPAVNVHLRNLRVKLDDDPANPRYVASVRGVGYKLLEEQP